MYVESPTVFKPDLLMLHTPASQNSTKDKNMTLASYLDLQHAPTRETLIADIVKQGIPGKVYPELQPLFKILEIDFQPLKVIY